MKMFDGFGVEIEYPIVSNTTLDILPVADELLRKAAGRYTNEYDAGMVGWSNEFVLHVIELRNSEPASSLEFLEKAFHEQVTDINRFLLEKGGQLMPAAMHPWMNPIEETRLWNRRNRKIYETYDRIFGCRKHGWANIQSMQLNISFSGDDEFGRLHAAIRLLLPLIPALAASSPVVEGRITGLKDNRLYYYRKNQMKVPSIAGKIIPEPVYTRLGYKHGILAKMYQSMAVFDREGTIRHEWLNSRGAIPRFDRNAIEIRIPDIQETPVADIAIAAVIINVLKDLVRQRWTDWEEQRQWKVHPLVAIFDRTIRDAESAVITDGKYLRTFGLQKGRVSAKELWLYLLEEAISANTAFERHISHVLRVILDHGSLATRIVRASGDEPSHEKLQEVYLELCCCLAEGRQFIP